LPSTHLTIKLRETAKKQMRSVLPVAFGGAWRVATYPSFSPRSWSRLRRRYEEFFAL